MADTKIPFISYNVPTYSALEQEQRAADFFDLMDSRRSIRHFSDKAVPKELIEKIIMTASTAPSGAHKQPWTFCAVGKPTLKAEIRKGAEEEEYTNYHGRMSNEWLDDLAKFETDWNKPFLEIAPWLIVVFKQTYEMGENGEKLKNYYVNESVGLAAGFLLAAIHNAGLASLTHTPSPMNFLCKILNRPANEKPFLLIPVGYPAEGCEVPDLKRKPLEKVGVVWE